MLSITSFCCNCSGSNGLSLGSPLQQSYVQNNKMQAPHATERQTHFWLPSLQRKLTLSAAFKAVTAVSKQPEKDLYGILGVAADASREEIKACYRRLARQLHPDSVASSASAVDFMAVQAAYSVLSDPESRAKYDRTVASLFLLRRFQRGTTARVGRRNWETDQCW